MAVSKKNQPPARRKKSVSRKQKSPSSTRKGQAVVDSNAMPEEEALKEIMASREGGVMIQRQYSGPLPRAEELAQYKHLVGKEAVSHILKNSDLNQENDRIIENRMVNRVFIIRLIEIIGGFVVIALAVYFLKDSNITIGKISIIFGLGIITMFREIVRLFNRMIGQD